MSSFTNKKEKANSILKFLKTLNDISIDKEYISYYLNDFRQNNLSTDFKEGSFEREFFQLIEKHLKD